MRERAGGKDPCGDAEIIERRYGPRGGYDTACFVAARRLHRRFSLLLRQLDRRNVMPNLIRHPVKLILDSGFRRNDPVDPYWPD